MPFTITLEKIPAGYAAACKRKGEEKAPVVVTEFVSSEDGDLFVSRLEGFPSSLLASHPGFPLRIRHSSVDHLLAIIYPSRKVTVYVNELSLLMRAQAKKGFKAGEMVFARDLVDIQRLALKCGSETISVPPETGVFFFVFDRLAKGDVLRSIPSGARIREGPSSHLGPGHSMWPVHDLPNVPGHVQDTRG
jgi:hypothetical protein